MDSMDIKGIAWVGNIYQKFEAMCLEVEEAMCQTANLPDHFSRETAKYVENQVQTVGASMKRFCSDVMEDLLPPSSKDISKVASAELLLNPYLEYGIHKKPISNIKEDATDPVCIKGISGNKSNSSNDDWEDWSAASFNWEISDKDETDCDRVATQPLNKARECESRGGQERKMNVDNSLTSAVPMTVFTKSSAKGGKRSRYISSSNIISVQRIDKSESSGLVSRKGSQVSSSSSSGQSIVGDVSNSESCENRRQDSLSHAGANTQCGQFVSEEALLSNTESSADFDPDLKEQKDITMQTMKPIGHESQPGFEDTCVLVNENDYSSVNHKEKIRRSYKKKIQNAFSLNKKSARKQEYKQLAAQLDIVNTESNTQGKVTMVHDSPESEWELV